MITFKNIYKSYLPHHYSLQGVNININGRFVQVDSDGKFTFTTTLNEGENKFTIIAQDLAENITEKTLTLHFSL